MTVTPARVLAATGLALLALVAGWLVGMRDKGSPVVRAQRRFNRDHLNPRQVGTAGAPGSETALVRHTGRRSGRSYATPVGAVATDDGFAIGMVYGHGTDWVQNLLAGGQAVLVHDGTEHPVAAVELVDLDRVADAYTTGQLRTMRLFGVREALLVRTRPQDQVA